MIAVGVQSLEHLQYWMEVRKINHIAQTDKKIKVSGIVTQRSVIVSLMEAIRRHLAVQYKTLQSLFTKFSFQLLCEEKCTNITGVENK